LTARGLGEGERQKPFLPGSKIFAPLRLCAFALKNDSGARPSRPTCVISFFKPQWIKPESRNPVAGIPAFPI
jgi:hypothetical protein